MNQISLLNRETNSKLSIRPEALNRNRTITIPDQGEFFLTNKTNLVQDLRDRYSVGPTGDFPNLQEAVRQLLIWKQYSRNKPRSNSYLVYLDLEDGYTFDQYFQDGGDASFIEVISATPVNIVSTSKDVFDIRNGAVSPRFSYITFNILITNGRLCSVGMNSVLFFYDSIFNITYVATPAGINRDNWYWLKSNGLLDTRYNSLLLIDGCRFTINLNSNNTNLNSYNYSILVCDVMSICSAVNTYWYIRDTMNKSIDSFINGFRMENGSYLRFQTWDSSETKVDLETQKGGFNLFNANRESTIDLTYVLKVKANTRQFNNNIKQRILLAYNGGRIMADRIVIKDSGQFNNPIGWGFDVWTGGVINVTGYRVENSRITAISNIPINQFNGRGGIYSN